MKIIFFAVFCASILPSSWPKSRKHFLVPFNEHKTSSLKCIIFKFIVRFTSFLMCCYPLERHFKRIHRRKKWFEALNFMTHRYTQRENFPLINNVKWYDECDEIILCAIRDRKRNEQVNDLLRRVGNFWFFRVSCFSYEMNKKC